MHFPFRPSAHGITRFFGKLFIILFCIWQSAAVLTYSLYNVEDVPILQWVSDQKDIFKPYVLATSQWQRWNLFSPDPLRRVIEMDIEQNINGKWITVHTINKHHLGWWQRAPELKIIRRMEDDSKLPLRQQYVQDYCRTHTLATGTHMRLLKRWFVIPKDTQWNTWKPEWNQKIDFDLFCTTV